MIEEVIKQTIPAQYLDKSTVYHVNPTGSFVVGGPHGDCGLTGRKIIVDTYGGYGRHGGGAFSGKDPSKVDRSACYMARHVAKNVVAAGLARKCEIQVAYAIGVAEPVSLSGRHLRHRGRARQQAVVGVARAVRLPSRRDYPKLDLKRPIYQPTAAYGHFGRTPHAGLFPGSKIDMSSALQSAFGANGRVIAPIDLDNSSLHQISNRSLSKWL